MQGHIYTQDQTYYNRELKYYNLSGSKMIENPREFNGEVTLKGEISSIRR